MLLRAYPQSPIPFSARRALGRNFPRRIGNRLGNENHSAPNIYTEIHLYCQLSALSRLVRLPAFLIFINNYIMLNTLLLYSFTLASFLLQSYRLMEFVNRSRYEPSLFLRSSLNL